ncbi:hypothetical protein OIU78_017366 [Salix suchowensis]|nr:hypothetical protein OIU78_017366 [Salix suchowensis]
MAGLPRGVGSEMGWMRMSWRIHWWLGVPAVGATSTAAARGGVGCLIEMVTSLSTADTSLLQQCPMGGYGGEAGDQRKSGHQPVEEWAAYEVRC